MKTLAGILLGLALLILLSFTLAPAFTLMPQWFSEVGKRAQGIAHVKIGDSTIPLLVADDEAAREHGLSDRATTSPAEGMLFVFPDDGRYGIWMKDMRFALDIVWVSAEGVVVGLKENALPESFPEVFKPDGLARYVIELPAGYAERLRLKVGSVVGL